MTKPTVFVSILGDSISTYRGISNDKEAHPSLARNPYFYREPFPLQETYWMRLIRSLGLTLCVNNAWSGGNLSGKEDESAGVNRACALSRTDGTSPDLVIVFMGINDLGRNLPQEQFRRDYEHTLAILRAQYPQAYLCCINLPDRDPVLSRRAECFNRIIDEAAKNAGERCFVADLFHSPLRFDTYYLNTLDGLHPDPDGMRMIAEVAEAAIRRHCKDLPLLP